MDQLPQEVSVSIFEGVASYLHLRDWYENLVADDLDFRRTVLCRTSLKNYKTFNYDIRQPYEMLRMERFNI